MPNQMFEPRTKLLLIYIDENDMWKGEPLYEAIVKKLREMDIAGATVNRGILGYGAHHRVPRRGYLVSNDLPITISVIDTEEKLYSSLPALQEMIGEGLIAATDVEILWSSINKPK